jgi:hypothetical protein
MESPDRLVRAAAGHGLRVLARGHWPESTSDALPALPGFVDSSFSPLVAEAASRCLRRYCGGRPADVARGRRTALVILTPLGDIVGARRVAAAVDRGARVGPLMFFQSVPNAVGGHIATRWGLAGPLLCLSESVTGLSAARLLLDDGDADEALVILAEQSTVDAEPDRAEAVLVAPDDHGKPR